MLYLAVSGGGRGDERGKLWVWFSFPLSTALVLLAVFAIGRGGDFLGAPFLPPPNTSFLSLSTAGIRKISYPS